MNSMQKLYEENKKLKQKADWYWDFVDYVQQNNKTIYEEACVHADYMEETIQDEKDEEAFKRSE
tara:strand:+ start:350 stop:541 length:192 start_codon:yes stop_codon:yes gene_type:complete